MANLADGDAGQWPKWPVAEHSSTSGPVANLAGGQQGLWSVGSGSRPEGEKASSGPVANLAGGKISDERSSSSGKKNKKENLSSSENRQDAEQLCTRLLSWMKNNQVRKTPDAVSDTWRREARLLLDKDHVSLDEALQVLDWCQRDGFWSQNIHSMPTFRGKYGQLEMKSRGLRGDASVRQLRPTGTDSRFAPQSGARARIPTAEELENMEIDI